jgi:hypothetical protein
LEKGRNKILLLLLFLHTHPQEVLLDLLLRLTATNPQFPFLVQHFTEEEKPNSSSSSSTSISYKSQLQQQQRRQQQKLCLCGDKTSESHGKKSRSSSSSSSRCLSLSLQQKHDESQELRSEEICLYPYCFLLAMRNLFLGWKVSGDGDTTREKFLTSTSSSSAGGASASSSSAGTSAAAAADGLWGKLLEPISPRDPRSPDEWLYNQDCAPTMKAGRVLTARDMGSLWVALVVGVPTYYLAGSLVEMGMAWWQGILTVLLANVIVLIPMVLSAHAGTKFGIPFPVIARASFGIRGANVPSLLRAFIGCGWFGIQTWIGGQAIFQLLNTLLVVHPHAQSPWPLLPWLGISAPEFASFLLCWLLQVPTCFLFFSHHFPMNV